MKSSLYLNPPAMPNTICAARGEFVQNRAMRYRVRTAHMSRPLPLIVQTEHLANVAAEWLRTRSTLVQRSCDDPQLSDSIANAEALIVRTYTIVDEALLQRAPKLRVVGRAGVGLDNIDVTACRTRGVEVVYTPDANTQAVVEYVLALTCDATRPRQPLTHPVDQKQWNELRSSLVAARQLNDMTLGILGMGRIGRRLAQIAKPLFANILYNDIADIESSQRFGSTPTSAPDLFSRADVLSVHIDGRPSNRSFINTDLLSRMKPDAILINTSRGFVIDNSALADALRQNPRVTAMLDVHEPEPFTAAYPLLHLPNAMLYPHLASRSERAMENMSWVVRDVIAVLEGQPPAHPAP